MNRLKVKDYKNLERDRHSKAIINTCTRDYLDYKNKLYSIKKRDEEIIELKKEIHNIKQILNLILEKI